MQELSNHVYLETSYAGVTLGAINWPHGMILIDAPFRVEDTRAWRSGLVNLNGGIDRTLINLDAHFDRTLGVRAMECTVLGHEKMSDVFHNRPVTFKTQGTETGADWELHNGLGSIRWAPPEITFSDRLIIHWDESPLILESHPGSAVGAIWAKLPSEKIVFLGDAVIANQPPFLAGGDLSAWTHSLKQLLTPEYQDFLLVSGRGGLVTLQHVHDQIHFLHRVDEAIGGLAKKSATPEDAASLAPNLLKNFAVPAGRETQYEQRLRYGLYHLFLRRFRPSAADPEV
jgi:hypothetical protein